MQGSYRKLEDLILDQLSAFVDYPGIVVVQPEHCAANAYFAAGSEHDLDDMQWIMVRKIDKYWKFRTLSEDEKKNFIANVGKS